MFFASCNNKNDSEINRLAQHFLVFNLIKNDEETVDNIFHQILCNSKLNTNS
jgi:hypothetical protein